MNRLRGVVIAASLAWTFGMVPACGGESIVIGGDTHSNDLGLSGTAGTATGGSAPTGGASFGTGGSTAGMPVTGGTPATGGVSVGGAVGTGGTAVSNGGVSTQVGGSSFGGTSTQTGGASGSGADGAVDPYPFVTWQGGQGYRYSCPRYDDAWGFTCWNQQNGACNPDGDPTCDLCSCVVPCGGGLECPEGVRNHPAECVESATTAPSCFLTCDGVQCPPGMLCSAYPGSSRNVCMWWAELDPT